MKPLPRVRSTILALVALVVASASGGSLAQGDSAPKAAPGASSAPAATKPAPPAAAANAEARDVISKDVAQAQARLDAIEASVGASLDAPPGTPAQEISERVTLARQLVGVYQQQRDILDRTEASRTTRTEAERAAQAWQGFAEPPPFSVLTIDALHDVDDNANARIAGAETRLAMFDRFGADLGPKGKASQAAARLAAEAADRARGTPGFAGFEWQRQLAALRAEMDQATQRLAQLGIRNAREDIAGAEVARDFARRQIVAIGGDIAFRPGDLDRIGAEIDTRQHAAKVALERATRVAAAAGEARAAAERELVALRDAPLAAGTDAAARTLHLDELATLALQKREEFVSATVRVNLLKGYLIALDGERQAWAARADALQTRDPLRSRAVFEQLTGTLTTIHAFREYLAQQLAAVRGQIVEQETKLRLARGEDAGNVLQLLDAYRQRESDLAQALDRGQPLERLLSHFRADFEGRRALSLTERVRDAGAAALLFARRVWKFEIFTVEDSLETADGRSIKVERSVTIGKSVGAVLIVILGYWLCSLIVRWIEHLLVRRGRAPQSAALMRSWILFVLAAILIIFALLSSSIPLTAFAFLGGALAIAAGFGLQTLLKNFVAGIMLLLERPMRLNDLVEVDGVRGRVTSIGIRASTITSGDGIETMIPNSAFVENKLTNWTYSSGETRHILKIGVAYGTPLREAADALLEVAARHGLVLKDPAPQVYLEEYADSAISFALTFWLDMAAGNDTRRVRSDILSMIDAAFAKAGIRMPFPQRDVHLDAAAPIKVEVVGKTGAGSS